MHFAHIQRGIWTHLGTDETSFGCMPGGGSMMYHVRHTLRGRDRHTNSSRKTFGSCICVLALQEAQEAHASV